jgi:LysR family transcriptional activator of nhaA
VGEPLFLRAGKGLTLTDTGRLVLGYCDEIFALGQELTAALTGQGASGPVTVTVGISDSMPKVVAYRLLEPALALPDPVRLVCREDHPDRLFGELSRHELDLVLSDAPLPAGMAVKAFNHILGESGIGLFAAPALATYAKGFPHSLNGAPLLLPSGAAAMRRELDAWLEGLGVVPRIVGEFQDSALLKTFGSGGAGLFPAHLALAGEIERMYGATCIGTCTGLRERFYVVSAERRITHPAVAAITHGARKLLRGR